MKKMICVIICVILLMPGCREMTLQEKYSELPLSETPLWSHFPIRVYEVDEGYLLCRCMETYCVPKVLFTPSREAIILSDWTPCELKEIKGFMGKPEQEIIYELGEPHLDVGSGFSWPAYVTADGYFIILGYNEVSVVDHISKTDILSGEIVEYYSDYIS